MENLKKSHLYVTYPKSVPSTLDGSCQEPVVFIFGWMGAHDKYLKVYSEIYEDLGFPTVRLTVSPLIILFRNSKMTKYADKLLTLLEEPGLKDRPVLFHLFSNGGSFQYEVFSSKLDESKRKLVKGVIFDSGPTKLSLHNSVTVFGTIIRPVIKNNLLYYFLIGCAMVCSASIIGVRKIQKNVVKGYIADPYNGLIKQENLCPQLFIYSKADSLVPYRELEVFIQARKAKGVEVMSKLYENSPHVKHYPSDKLGYSRTVYRFLNKVLKK